MPYYFILSPKDGILTNSKKVLSIHRPNVLEGYQYPNRPYPIFLI